MIPGGNLRDFEAVAKHFYYEGQRSGSESQLPLMFMGAVTTAIGATMMVNGGRKMWADRAKDQARAHAGQSKPSSHAERVRRRKSQDHER